VLLAFIGFIGGFVFLTVPMAATLSSPTMVVALSH
jgi:hypothetical protein